MTEALATRSVVVERVFPHSPAKVWRALTERDLLARWMMPNDFEPVVGRSFSFRTGPVAHWDGVVDCEVLEIDPPQRLVLRWGVGAPGQPGSLLTTVAFTLTPDGAGTKFRMEQSGFTDAQEMNRRGATFGLNRMADQLGALLGEI